MVETKRMRPLVSKQTTRENSGETERKRETIPSAEYKFIQSQMADK
jgi:hypothetical protein